MTNRKKLKAVPATGKALRDAEKEERKDKELEEACEKWCGRIIKLAFFVPLLLNGIVMPLVEYSGRPTMVLDSAVDMTDVQAIVTGGCGAIGRRTAALLAESGASVVLACRDPSSERAGDALARLVDASEARGGNLELQHTVWPIDMADTASVRRFAARFVAERSALPLKLLLNNAGTRDACAVTPEAGIESAFASNFVGHFLLTKLLLPTLRAAKPARVVSVACREGYLRSAAWRDGKVAAWLGRRLPIPDEVDASSAAVVAAYAEGAGSAAAAAAAEEDDPFGETDAAAADAQTPAALALTRCIPATAYANSKLALVAFSFELERRLRRSGARNEGVVSHVINPNVVASTFAARGNAAPKSSLRAKVMAYFPPFWLLQKAYGAGTSIISFVWICLILVCLFTHSSPFLLSPR